MHKTPIDSGFLAAKFIRLSEKLDVHLLVWDSKENVRRFIEQNNLSEGVRKKIHIGYTNKVGIISTGLNFIKVYLSNKKVRNYILNGEGSLIERIKFIIIYVQTILLNPDVVHFEFGTLAQKATNLKKLLNAKLSVSFRGYDLNYAGLEYKDYYTQVWENFDGFHFLGNDLKQRAIKRGYIANKVEFLIPPAIDTNFYKPSFTKKRDDKLIIISVGRLVWKKGYEYGVRAVSLLKNNGFSFEYRIIGGGDSRQALQFTIDELGLQNEVKLLDELSASEIKLELESAHVFLHPAISEGFSNAVLEAQAMGVPVICTDADGLSENIEDKVTGFIVPKWNIEVMAERLSWCCENSSELQNMGEAGINRVNRLFRIDKQIADFANFYRKLAGNEN